MKSPGKMTEWQNEAKWPQSFAIDSAILCTEYFSLFVIRSNVFPQLLLVCDKLAMFACDYSTCPFFQTPYGDLWTAIGSLQIATNQIFCRQMSKLHQYWSSLQIISLSVNIRRLEYFCTCNCCYSILCSEIPKFGQKAYQMLTERSPASNTVELTFSCTSRAN